MNTAGYMIVPSVVSRERCAQVADSISASDSSSDGRARAGDRDVLFVPAIRELANLLRSHAQLAPFIPDHYVATQGTFFDKGPNRNWLVAIHQDLSIAVRKRIESPNYRNWSLKQGVQFVQPPIEVLQSLVAIRLHLDDCSEANGALRVVPQSHLRGRWTQAGIAAERATLAEVTCSVPCGGVLAMSPLILHASSKATSQQRRRVLHFVFGPRELPDGVEWSDAV